MVRVIRNITIVGIVLSVVGAIICFSNREMINDYIGEAIASGSVTADNLQIGNGTLKFVLNYQDAFAAGNYAVPMVFNCIAGAITCLVVAVILNMFINIFKSLAQEETPFSENILKRLRNIFIIITVLIAAYLGVGLCIVGALLLWCIYSILEYGVALQTEVDELL